ncbi:MAG: glycosyltransferase [Saprospiraceae bacterium]
MVTVVTPAFNSAAYISAAIESVLKQTFQDLEMIVVDDGSTDNTKEIVSKYVQKYPEKIRYLFQENRGPGAARNTAIRNACGDYLALLDADDIWLPEKLALQLQFLKENPAYSFVFTDAFAMDETGKKGETMMQLKNPVSGRVFFDLIKQNFILSPTPLAKKESFEKVGYFSENRLFRVGEDHHFWLKVAHFYQGGYLDKPLACYRMRQEGLSGGGVVSRCKGIDGQLLVLDAISQEFPVASKKGKPHFRRARAILHFEMGYAYYRENNFTQARREFLLSIKEDWLFGKAYHTLFLVIFFPRNILIKRNEKKEVDEAQWFGNKRREK